MTRMAGFSEATYIALHSMALIARKKGERISIGEMAKTLGVSGAHLAKVILRLSRSGFIVTTRGPGGGAVLARKPEEINFLDIVEAIEGPLENSDCVFGRRSCVYKACIFDDFLVKMTREAREWLKAKTLAEF